MFINLLFVFFTNFGVIFSKLASDLPSGFPRCSANDQNFKQCTTKAANDARSFLIKGIPELGIPPIDPLSVTQVTLKTGSETVNIEAKLTNITVKGLNNYVMPKFEIDFNENKIDCVSKVDYITMDGDFTINGQILLVKLSTAGKFHASFNNTQFSASQKFDIVTINNQKYLKPVNTFGKMTNMESPKLKFFDLIGGNTELEQLELRVIDENIDVLFEELKPSIEKIVLEVLSDVLLKPIENQVPLANLVPNSPL